jgi:hypothetical protein
MASDQVDLRLFRSGWDDHNIHHANTPVPAAIVAILTRAVCPVTFIDLKSDFPHFAQKPTPSEVTVTSMHQPPKAWQEHHSVAKRDMMM